jgi:hypothetical protein
MAGGRAPGASSGQQDHARREPLGEGPWPRPKPEPAKEHSRRVMPPFPLNEAVEARRHPHGALLVHLRDPEPACEAGEAREVSHLVEPRASSQPPFDGFVEQRGEDVFVRQRCSPLVVLRAVGQGART